MIHVGSRSPRSGEVAGHAAAHDHIMRNQRLLSGLLVGFLVVGAVSSCGDDDDAAASPADVDLDGRTFVATGAEGFTVVEGSEIVLSFTDGVVVIEAGCNTQRGDYEVTDGVLVVDLEAMASTMMACDEPLMAQDETVAGLVTSGPAVELDGAELVLAGEDASLSLTARG
jgi:heat shock protein HslJ